MTDNAQKVRENRLRRAAVRQGFKLVKSSRQDPLAFDFGKWMIIDPDMNAVVTGAEIGGRPSMDIDEVEAWLMHPESRKARKARKAVKS